MDSPMSDHEKDLERRIRLVKTARTDLADKDLSKTENLDVDAFQRLFSAPLPPGGAAETMRRMIAEEHAQTVAALKAMTDEEKARLVASGKAFTLIDGTHVQIVDAPSAASDE
jgi:hypothetical protein